MATASDSDVNFDTFDFDGVVSMSKYIDRGAYGDVYGPFLWNSKECAFKRILISKGSSDAFEIKVKEKKDIWTSLKHKNLVEIHHVSVMQQAIYLVMEYANGGSLLVFLQKSDVQFPVSKWARQIAEGMQFLHENGIVHRDLKSGNIMIMDSLNDDKEMTLKITDFDEVKEHNQTTTMSLRGTVAYMAPEVLKTQRFSKASDVWSYGLVMREMLTKELPHKGLEVGEIMYKAFSGQFTLSIPESIPEAYKELLHDCLCHDTQSRPSFKKIVDELSNIDIRKDIGEPNHPEEEVDGYDGHAGQRHTDSSADFFRLNQKQEQGRNKQLIKIQQPQQLMHGASFTNDEIRLRIQNIYTEFVSDVDPDRLSDWLVQENVMTIDQWQRIRHENLAKPDRCRALLGQLFKTQHPRSFLVVYEALSTENHYLIEHIEKQETGYGIRAQPDTKTTLQAGSTANDDIKLRIQKVYVRFVSDVDPDRLSDWLVQENVILIDQWQRIRHDNPPPDRCRALLNHLFSIQHPRAFLVVREALQEDNHYLLEYIDKQET